MRLRKRKGKNGLSWFIDFTDHNGKRTYHTLKGIQTQKNAELAFAEFQIKYERQQLGLPTDEDITIADVLDNYHSDRRIMGCTDRWVERIQDMSKNLIDFFGKARPFKSLSDEQIARYRQHRLDADAAIETVNKELKVLVAGGRLAVRQNKIAYLPWSRMHLAIDRTGRQTWSYMTAEEIVKLLSLLRDGGDVTIVRRNKRPMTFAFAPRPKLWAVVTFLLNTGARRGEMFALRWSDVDSTAKLIRLVGRKSARVGKPAQPRYISMNPALEMLFATLPRGGAHDLVFKHDWNMNRDFDHALKCAGLSHYRIHDLRHTFASHLAMNGVPIYTISKLLGHSTIEMSQRYAHLDPTSLASAVQVLNFSAPPAKDVPDLHQNEVKNGAK